MANGKQIEYLRGKAHWFKVLGDPVDNYGKDGKEWIFDLALDDGGVKQVKSIKIQGKPALNIKDKDDDRGKFVTFKQKYRELRKTGPNGEKLFSKAPKVIDAAGNAWDPEVKLGNGSTVDVKFEIVDYGPGKFPGIYPQAIRVLDHVPFEGGGDFKPLSPDDEFFGKAPPSGFRTVGDILNESRDGFEDRTASDLDDDLP